MKFIEKIVNWCLKTEKIENKEEKFYINCRDYFLHAKSKVKSDEVEEFLNEVLFVE